MKSFKTLKNKCKKNINDTLMLFVLMLYYVVLCCYAVVNAAFHTRFT